jgi:hypothetical protein
MTDSFATDGMHPGTAIHVEARRYRLSEGAPPMTCTDIVLFWLPSHPRVTASAIAHFAFMAGSDQVAGRVGPRERTWSRKDALDFLRAVGTDEDFYVVASEREVAVTEFSTMAA